MNDQTNATRPTSPVVRQLPWTESKDGVFDISAYARTSIGRYEAWYFRLNTEPPKDCYGWKGPFTSDAEADSYEAATAAAQADFEARINAELEPSAATGPLDDVRQWQHYPIAMPLTDQGEGPATVGFDAVKITYEVWDRENVSHGSYDYLSDAINESMRLNALPSSDPPEAAADQGAGK